MTRGWTFGFAVSVVLLTEWALGEEALSARDANAAGHGSGPVASAAFDPGEGAAIERVPLAAPNPCELDELTAAPSRPVWTAGAQTTQCGSLETDYGWFWQGMGGGVRQTATAMSVRYGITPRLDVRWGIPAHLVQSGGESPDLTGVSDQTVSLTWRFMEQGTRVPAMALGYGFKIPTANPAKGFGTGYVDHQLAFIASRNVRKLHLDFNSVGTLAGCPDGHDPALLYGLVMSAPATRRMTWLLETVGGSQPGTADRLGQSLLGAQWTVRPWLVLDTAYTRAWTAGSPRQQFTVGWTWASRPRAVDLLREKATRVFAR